MSRRPKLVTQYIENIHRDAFEDHADLIRELTRHRSGIYALYRKGRLCYVGLAGDLRWRVRQHIRDKHQGKWDRFTPEEIANATVSVADPAAIDPRDVVPEVVSRDNPMYPLAVIQEHKSGSATAEFWIKADGSVEKVKIIRTTDQRFAGPVAAPLARWKFEPPIRDGRVTRMKVRVVCTFTYAGPVEGIEAAR